MGWSDKIFDALRASVVLNERVTGLAGKLERLDRDVRELDRRVVRLETFIEIVETRQRKLPSE